MDSLGEVGKKMRVSKATQFPSILDDIFAILIDFQFFSKLSQQSAIKAKLLELGTGSQTGYIDDELPDYVMIMVANKRSKSQMLTDLNLFLGTNTGKIAGEVYESA
jgi:hypothetical protein